MENVEKVVALKKDISIDKETEKVSTAAQVIFTDGVLENIIFASQTGNSAVTMEEFDKIVSFVKEAVDGFEG